MTSISVESSLGYLYFVFIKYVCFYYNFAGNFIYQLQ